MGEANTSSIDEALLLKNFYAEDEYYDGRTIEWDQYEWSKQAIHIGIRKQTKWYMQLVKKHRLEISQPGLEPNEGLTMEMTKRRGDKEVHKVTDEKLGWCSDPHLPPCAAFVEIMAPVFSRVAWRCAWYMIQNDLVHGWGLDFALRRCVDPAHEKIGVVDSQWIVHQHIPSLGGQSKFDMLVSSSNRCGTNRSEKLLPHLNLDD